MDNVPVEETKEADEYTTRQSNNIRLYRMQSTSKRTLKDASLQNVIGNEETFNKALKDEKCIVLEGIISTYSPKENSHIEIGCILTAKCMYLINANNYYLWREFEERSKIQTLSSLDPIDSKTAIQIIENMNISPSNSDSRDKIKKYLINKSIYDLKRNMLLESDTKRKTLDEIFGLETNDIIPSILKIKISHFFDENVIKTDERNEILSTLLSDLSFRIEQRQINNDLVLTLDKHITAKDVQSMNDKLQKMKLDKEVFISAEIKPRPKINELIHIDGVITIDLSQYNDLQIVDYGFVLNDGNNDILFFVENRNQCFEWIAHIDAVLHPFSEKIQNKKGRSPSKQMAYNKYIHDFKYLTIQNDLNEHKLNEFINDFGFGMAVDYWKKDGMYSVVPKYTCLKEELLKNKVCNITQNEYYNLYTSCRQRKTKLRCSAIQRPEGMECDEKLTVNHMISMKLFCDFGKVRRNFIKCCQKLNEHESLEDFKQRNAEIAHFCRYLLEYCKYFGHTMSKKAIYIGLENTLLFRSLQIDIQCPILATTDSSITHKWKTKKNGMILSLKPLFDGTKCVLMRLQNECVVHGEYMQISNIFINGMSHKLYIAAIQLFENIVNGYFCISHHEITEKTLYSLVCDYFGYQKDDKIPHFIKRLFANIVENTSDVWLNKMDLALVQNGKLQKLFYDVQNDQIGELIKYQKVNFVEFFKWNISSSCKMNASHSMMICNEYQCGKDIALCFEIWPKQCLLRIHVNRLPKNFKAVKIGINILIKEKKMQILSKPEWVSNFHVIELVGCNDFDWKSVDVCIGIKIMDFARTNVKQQIDEKKDVNIDLLAAKIRNEVSNDLKKQIEDKMKKEYEMKLVAQQKEIDELKERIDFLHETDLAASRKKTRNQRKSKSFGHSESLLRVTKRKKKKFSLM